MVTTMWLGHNPLGEASKDNERSDLNSDSIGPKRKWVVNSNGRMIRSGEVPARHAVKIVYAGSKVV